MARIPLPTPKTMTPAQRTVHDAVVSGPRGTLVGPLRAALHHPELADKWQQLGAVLRYGTGLPPRLSELAILATARHWNAQVEFHIHAQAAEKAGLAPTTIAAIRDGKRPEFTAGDEVEVYDFARQILASGRISDAVYGKVLERWKAVGIVDLTALIGYYTMVAMTLNAHRIPLPGDAAPPLDLPGGGEWERTGAVAGLPLDDDLREPESS